MDLPKVLSAKVIMKRGSPDYIHVSLEGFYPKPSRTFCLSGFYRNPHSPRKSEEEVRMTIKVAEGTGKDYVLDTFNLVPQIMVL